ncbi:hypothetical protein C8A05DRAFT_35109 [Staphylotrichum tortipilum]|uniref:Rhodopsin domain-containing protein n=1 Tax=Staphylotrichum tortipilum TaxID=2831512 RepID=A0AAN6MJB6_9PEZI|nr:hypothetical protein C8A05DRAFT_35109 [Staphylotrichum longicolle]
MAVDPSLWYPPGLVSRPEESHQAGLIAASAVTWAIGAFFVALRFYARGCLLRNAIGVEDWLIIVALVFSGATCAGMIEQAVYGNGKHYLDIDPAVRVPMSRAGWYSILWYMMSLLFTKIAILLLYLRVLSFRHARYIVYALLATVIIANGIWTLYTVLTACKPLRAFWIMTPGAWCRPNRDWYANTGLHIGTDFLMYLLPLPVVITLRVDVRQKLALYGIMLLGLLVCLISVVRLWDLTQQYKRIDYTYDNISIGYLTVVEINAAIACACCMTLRPLMNKLFPNLWSARNSDSSGGDSPASPGSPHRQRDVEMRGRPDNFSGPPTIGSRPLRHMRFRRDDTLDRSHALTHNHNVGGEEAGHVPPTGHEERRGGSSGGSSGGDGKRSIQTMDTDEASLSGAGEGRASPGGVTQGEKGGEGERGRQ